jgi:hypothetical protein
MRSQALMPITRKEKQKYIAYQYRLKNDIRGIIEKKKIISIKGHTSNENQKRKST